MNSLAYILSESGGNLDEALNLALRAREKDPNDPHYSDTLGWIYFRKHTNQNGAPVFRVLTERYPENATYRYHLGMALLENGDKSSAKNELVAALSDTRSVELRREIAAAIDQTQ